MHPHRYISVFSGAMGLDIGLEAAGLIPAVCVENNADAAQTIQINRPDIPVVEQSAADVTGGVLLDVGLFSNADVPLLAGGPPCQAFSVSGKRKGLSDARGRLVF